MENEYMNLIFVALSIAFIAILLLISWCFILSKKLDRLSSRMSSEIERIEGSLKTDIAEIKDKLDSVEEVLTSKMTKNSIRLDAVQNAVDENTNKLVGLASEISENKEKIKEVETRVADVVNIQVEHNTRVVTLEK